MRVLITGACGLVGSECVRHFDALGWKVYGIDNNQRAEFFGPDGNTTPIRSALFADCRNLVECWNASVADCGPGVMCAAQPDLIIHAAAQPSHDWAASNPLEDFRVNALGTLNMLEAARQYAPDAAFVFLSTNKVYGDAPNHIEVLEDWQCHGDSGLEQKPTRWQPTGMGNWTPLGFDETLPVDACTHSLFGCSKLAADLYVQEYGRYFGLKTVCFRCGCLTGSAHASAEQHGFLAYLCRCVREGRKYRVYGYKGKQVRDNLHAYDVATACEEFAKAPRAGEVYNLGGGPENSISVLEAIEWAERLTGKKLDWEYVDQPRKGDHIWYVSDTSKFRQHYPGWRVTRSLESIMQELCGQPIERP